MIAAVLKDKEQLIFEERPIPVPAKNEVLIKVAYAGICGTDVSAYKNLSLPKGTVMGHEFSGTVVKTGEDVRNFKQGGRVVVRPASMCNDCPWCKEGKIALCVTHLDETIGLKNVPGAYAHYVLAKNYQVFTLPPEITLEQAAQLEPLAVSVHGVEQGDVKLGDRVLIIGSGPIGLLVYQCVKLKGAGEVVILEKSQLRLNKARELGCRTVLDNPEVLKDILTGYPRKGFDVVFECAGKEATIQLALDLAAKGGKVVFMGISAEPVKINHFSMVFKGIDARASIGYYVNDWDVAMDLLKSKKVEVDTMVTKIYPLSEIKKGFNDLLDPEKDLKILIKAND